MSDHCDTLVQWNTNSARKPVNTVTGWIWEQYREDENRHGREEVPFIGLCRMMESIITVSQLVCTLDQAGVNPIE